LPPAPRSVGTIEDAPFVEDVFALVDDEVEWDWPVTPALKAAGLAE